MLGQQIIWTTNIHKYNIKVSECNLILFTIKTTKNETKQVKNMGKKVKYMK